MATLYMASVLAGMGARGLAARILDGTMDNTEAAGILSRLGIEADDAPVLVLSDLLSGALEKMAEMGADLSPDGVLALRRFFMGVLGWPPDTVMRDATLDDLRDALAGYCTHHGIARGGHPGARFLGEMMKKFPNAEAGHAEKRQ